jgi:hypothetical protein
MSNLNSLDDIYGAGGGNYLKPKDLQPQERPFFWIRSATVVTKTFKAEEGPKTMIELKFFETPDNPLSSKTWSLNKTQALALQQLYGSFENWAFKGVRIYVGQTTFQGQQKQTLGIYPDPYEMDANTRAAAEQALQAIRAQEAQAAQTPAYTGPPQAQQAAPAPAFTPPSSAGFAPPAPTDHDPTKNW